MTDQDLALSIQQSAKFSLQEERKIQEEREFQILQKNKELQKKMEESSMPQSALKLRPTKQITQEKQRLSREMILQSSKDLRNTHQPTPFPLTFQMRRSNHPDEENDQKLRAVKLSQQQRQLTKINYLKHVAVEVALEQQHHAAIEHHHMPPTPRPHRF